MAHHITASSSSSSNGAGGFETGPSAKSTDVFSNNQNTSTDSEKTIIVTSTPLKSDQPPWEDLIWRQCLGDSLQLPSEIFESPASGEDNARIQPDEEPYVEIISEDLNDGMNKCPSSYESTSTSEDDLDQALKRYVQDLDTHPECEEKKIFLLKQLQVSKVINYFKKGKINPQQSTTHYCGPYPYPLLATHLLIRIQLCHKKNKLWSSIWTFITLDFWIKKILKS